MTDDIAVPPPVSALGGLEPHEFAAAVGEVSGPAFTPVQTASALAIGAVSLLISGLLPVLLGALAEEHRLSPAGIGQLAMFEALSTGLATGLAGALLKPSRLRLIGILASGGLVLANLATVGASGPALTWVRIAAGVPEGVLLWITVGLIARTESPERWAGVLFTVMPLSQLAFILLLSTAVLPRFGADGAYRALAASALAGVIASLGLAGRYGALPGTGGETGPPPPRGWAALAATLAYVGAIAAAAVYLVPLAKAAGLPVGVARTALGASLLCQVLGGALATGLSGRVHFLGVFAAGTAAYLGVWISFALGPPAWLFVGASGVAGLFGTLCGAFLVPMTIGADPSRRAAMQSGGVQLFAGALGPLLASFAVGSHGTRGALVLAAALLLIGFAGIAVLSRPPRTVLAG